jgi:hypothetical protein
MGRFRAISTEAPVSAWNERELSLLLQAGHAGAVGDRVSDRTHSAVGEEVVSWRHIDCK